MFGKRSDARLIKTLGPMQKISPYIMKTRTDAMNMFEESISCEKIDSYIASKAEEGIEIEYMHIIIAALVRVLALKPQLNRYVMRGRIFARKKIWISFVVHRSFKHADDGGTTLKLCFDGTENLFEVAKIVNKAVQKEVASVDVENGTDKLAATLTRVPGWMISLAVNFLMFLDRHDMLPQSVIDLSPFHTSVFLTNMKSLGINHVFHHVYEFGTTGLFLALGKERSVPVATGTDEVKAKKMLGLGLVMDERFCDGLYFARSLKLLKKYLRHPNLLEEGLDAVVEDIP